MFCIHIHRVMVILHIVNIITPEGMPGMSDVSLLSGISGLSFDSPFFLFLPSPLALSVVSFFCLWSVLGLFFQKTQIFFIKA